MFQLENKWFLYAFALLPVLVIVQILLARSRKKKLEQFGEHALVMQLAPTVSGTKRKLKFALFIIGFLFLVAGIINPQVGTKLEEVKRKGADLMICLDVSNSMKAEDLVPNRLEKAKQALAKLIEKLEGDRIGIIVFGGDAYVQLPITTDYAAAKMFLESISTDMVPTQGTAIGKAIDLAVESFGKDEGKNKAIVIITDGENHEDNAVDAAEAAAEKGISIHTIGMGSVEGGPIPIYKGTVLEGYKKDKDGNTVVTKLDENMLQEIAAAGKGIFVRASNSDAGLNNVLDELDKLEKKEFESKMFSDYEDRFQWFIFVAFVFLLIDGFVSERKSVLLEKIDLFGKRNDTEK